MSLTGTLTGVLGGIASGDPLGGAVGSLTQSVAGAGLDAIDSWVLDGARSALASVAHVIGASTAPNLTSTWFSATYWRVAGLATLLTLPFLFAAAVHALLRSDLMLLSRAALVQLPLALLGVSLAAPVVMLLLAATDQMSSLVAGTGVDGGARFLTTAAAAAGGASVIAGSPFFAIVIGLLTVAAALALMIELLIREAAVYVVVLMLPLAFAALVWPARRVWAVRLLELLTALILSKFAIVAVLSLAGSALGHSGGIPQILVAMTLVLLSCLAPWALLRLIPFTELGAAASETIRHHGQSASRRAMAVTGVGMTAADSTLGLTGMLRRQAQTDGQAGVESDGYGELGTYPTGAPIRTIGDDGSSAPEARERDESSVSGAGSPPVEPGSAGPSTPGSNPSAGVPPADAAVVGDNPPHNGHSADPAGDAEPAPKPGWWEVEDMSLPGIHLGSKGLGGPDWVPPMPERTETPEPHEDEPAEPQR